MRDHDDRNRASRERLARLIARLEDSDVALPDGWTAGALLAHLAFWDRFAAARLTRYVRDHQPMPLFDTGFFDLVNAGGLPQWRATSLVAAAADATASAAAGDQLIERLSADDAAAIGAQGILGALDRSRHRNGHLDQLERALG